MDLTLLLKHLPLVNSLVLATMFVYIGSRASRHASVFWFAGSMVPLIVFQIGSYVFMQSPSRLGPLLIVLGINLIPIGFVPFGQALGREAPERLAYGWRVYYAAQLLILVFVVADLTFGHFVEWVTGVLDQPVILIEKTR